MSFCRDMLLDLFVNNDTDLDILSYTDAIWITRGDYRPQLRSPILKRLERRPIKTNPIARENRHESSLVLSLPEENFCSTCIAIGRIWHVSGHVLIAKRYICFKTSSKFALFLATGTENMLRWKTTSASTQRSVRPLRSWWNRILSHWWSSQKNNENHKTHHACLLVKSRCHIMLGPSAPAYRRTLYRSSCNWAGLRLKGRWSMVLSVLVFVSLRSSALSLVSLLHLVSIQE